MSATLTHENISSIPTKDLKASNNTNVDNAEPTPVDLGEIALLRPEIAPENPVEELDFLGLLSEPEAESSRKTPTPDIA